ncbi:MAG: TldD/PmbA family protein [Thermoplasmata archaeon]
MSSTAALQPIADRVAATLEALPEGVEADARVVYSNWGTMRFANSRIHQPHLERATTLSIRIWEDQRLGTATSVDTSKEGIALLLRRARALAHVAPPERKFPGFPQDGGRSMREVGYSTTTARLSPEAQVRLAERALRAAEDARPHSRVSGAVNVGERQLVVVNSNGLSRTTRRSMAQASVLVERPDDDPPVSGWSEALAWSADRLDTSLLGREAAERMASAPPAPVEAGKYRVLLAGPAASELFGWLCYLGFSGHSEQEGWSCLRRYRGRRIGPADLSVIDDPRASASLPQAIDYEGVVKRPVPLVEEGVARAAVTDLVTAGRLGVHTSGHAQPPEWPEGDAGPLPSQTLVAGGSANWDELVRETRRGLLVTRFHYVRVVHPGKGILTGMTRDGTYRIERGEIVGPVRNLRFTESVLTAIKHLELLGKDRRCYGDERGTFAITTPPVVTGEFRFTSATLF